jgi:hypothetical protein
MARGSSTPCSARRSGPAEPPDIEPLSDEAARSGDGDDSSPLDPSFLERSLPPGRLERGNDDERRPTRREVVREGLEQPGRGTQAVGPAVEREVDPSVRVPLPRPRGKVRRVREDPVEPSEAPREVGPHFLDAEAAVPSEVPKEAKRLRVPVGRDDPPARSRRCDAEGAAPRADVEQPARTRLFGEREQ